MAARERRGRAGGAALPRGRDAMVTAALACIVGPRTSAGERSRIRSILEAVYNAGDLHATERALNVLRKVGGR